MAAIPATEAYNGGRKLQTTQKMPQVFFTDDREPKDVMEAEVRDNGWLAVVYDGDPAHMTELHPPHKIHKVLVDEN